MKDVIFMLQGLNSDTGPAVTRSADGFTSDARGYSCVFGGARATARDGAP